MVLNKKGTGGPAQVPRLINLREPFFNKKGLSQVVGTLLMVLMTIAAVAAVWGVIDSFVNTKLEDTAACYDVYDKVALNSRYTCYNATGNQTYISIEIKDIEIDALKVAVQREGVSESFELTNTLNSVNDVYYSASPGDPVKLPSAESGKTYVLNVTGLPQKISIAPRVSGKQCDASSILSTIQLCI